MTTKTSTSILCTGSIICTERHTIDQYSAPKGLRVLGRGRRRLAGTSQQYALTWDVPVCDLYQRLKELRMPASAALVSHVINHALKRDGYPGLFSKTLTITADGKRKQTVVLHDVRRDQSTALPDWWSKLGFTIIDTSRYTRPETEADEASVPIHAFLISPGVEAVDPSSLCARADCGLRHDDSVHSQPNVSRQQYERAELLAEASGVSLDEVLDGMTFGVDATQFADLSHIPDAKPRPVTVWVRGDDGSWKQVTHVVNVHVPTRVRPAPQHLRLDELSPDLDEMYRPFRRPLVPDTRGLTPTPTGVRRIKRTVLDLDGNVVAVRHETEPAWAPRELTPLAEPDPKVAERELEHRMHSLPRASRILRAPDGRVLSHIVADARA